MKKNLIIVCSFVIVCVLIFLSAFNYEKSNAQLLLQYGPRFKTTLVYTQDNTVLQSPKVVVKKTFYTIRDNESNNEWLMIESVSINTLNGEVTSPQVVISQIK